MKLFRSRSRSFSAPTAATEANYKGLLQWVNVTFPVRPNARKKRAFEGRGVQNRMRPISSRQPFARLTIVEVQPRRPRSSQKSRTLCHRAECRSTVSGRSTFLGWTHLREGIQLQRIGQKDPLVEYKNEAYSMFVELMTNIKFEVLHQPVSAALRTCKPLKNSSRACLKRCCTQTLSGARDRCVPPQQASAAQIPIADALSPRPAKNRERNGCRRSRRRRLETTERVGRNCPRWVATIPALAAAVKSQKTAAEKYLELYTIHWRCFRVDHDTAWCTYSLV